MFRKVPSYTALRNLLVKIDPHQLADCLNQWLQANLGTPPRALAVDGKWIRDRALSLCVSEHQTGALVAMGFAKEKTGDGFGERFGSCLGWGTMLHFAFASEGTTVNHQHLINDI